MKCVQGVWLPDEETEISKFLNAEQIDGVGVYQYAKLRAALAFVKNWRVAVDVGAHCGLWSMQLVKKFQVVHAFEPIERHRECLVKNAPKAILWPVALGDKHSTVSLKKGIKSTGDTQIAADGEYESEIHALDSYLLTEVDFMKLDCEGYELFVLRGGEKLINECRPVMIVEQKPGKGKFYGLGDTEAVKWLQAKGYKLQGVISGDYILTPT
jgi:FkbM family methyltransferase